MDLRSEVLMVLQHSNIALTVDQVAQKVAERLHDDIRSILNELVKDETLRSVHGGGGYRSTYMSPPLTRRN